jgi:formylglycine-generating enzyme required for sulfatase activity
VDLTTGSVVNVEDIPDLLTNDEYKTTKLVLKWIPDGIFQMGDQVGGGDPDELPVHTVNITQSFYIGVFEVTQRQWYEIQGDWPSHFTTNPDKRPVEKISWNDITGSGGLLESLDSLTGYSFRLPTEAEWEYCCKAGTTTNYSYGDTADGAYMWYLSNAGSGTHEVGTRLPNPWGLYDMHGNVWEWCQDWHDSGYYQYCVNNTITDDPQGPASGTGRILRAGCWNNDDQGCRSADRANLSPSDSSDNRTGVRIAGSCE